MLATRSKQASIRIDWVVQQALKNLLMHMEPVVYLRKRLSSRENGTLVNIGRYFDSQWQTYLSAILSLNLAVDNANVLEIGPGPILANGIRFIAEGAARYTAIDRFDILRRDGPVRRAYHELVARLSLEQQQRCLGLIADQTGGRLFDSRIESVVAKIEECGEQLDRGRWDFVVSFDVLEHVDDLTGTLRAIRTLLKPGGVMIHRVDVGADNVTANVHRLAHLVFRTAPGI